MTTTQPADETAELGNLLGRRLRERRRELGLTLADVAAAAGISVGHSSSIEKGSSLPSLPVLARLAHALELTLAEVLRASANPRIAEGRIGASPGPARLTPVGSPIQIWSVRLTPSSTGLAPFAVTSDDVFVFVHDGSIQIDVNGERHELGPGDSIHCHVPRTIEWRAAAGPATTIWVARAGRRPDPASHE